MGLGGFSWKRAVGITRIKSNISRSIGIPLTKSGRQRKVGKAVGCGCMIFLIACTTIGIGVAVGAVLLWA